MLDRMTEKDALTLTAVTLWFVVFGVLMQVFMHTGIGAQYASHAMSDETRSGVVLAITVALVLASAWAGKMVINPEKWDGVVVYGAFLSMANTAWLSFWFAHVVYSSSHDFPTNVFFLFFVAMFYTTWVSYQMSNRTAALILFLSPVAVAALSGYAFLEETRFAVYFSIISLFVAIVFLMAIRGVEEANVNVARRATGLILFVQSIALAALALRLASRLAHDVRSDDDNEGRGAKALTMEGIDDLWSPAQAISFGSTTVAILYVAILHAVLYAVTLQGAANTSGLPFISALVIILVVYAYVFSKNRSHGGPQRMWGFFGYIYLLHIMFIAFGLAA